MGVEREGARDFEARLGLGSKGLLGHKGGLRGLGGRAVARGLGGAAGRGREVRDWGQEGRKTQTVYVYTTNMS